MSGLEGLLPLVLIVVVFWFLLIRPQRRRQQEMSRTQSSLKVGTEVMLTSGIFGTVASLDDETIGLELAPGTRVKVSRQAIARIIEPTPDLEHDDEPNDERVEAVGDTSTQRPAEDDDGLEEARRSDQA